MYNTPKDVMNHMTMYFDKRVPEEDTPITVSDAVQLKYERLEAIYEEFFDDNSLHLAKVF